MIAERATRPSEPTVEAHTIVVGAGSGGATIAGLLAAHGTEPVTLVEAGPDYGARDSGRWPPEMRDARSVPITHDWGFTSGSAYPDRVLDYPRARIVGGCSAHNGCTIAASAHADWDAWAMKAGAQWCAQAIEPLIDMARRRLLVRQFADEELTPAQAAFVAAAQRAGLPLVHDLDQLTAGVGVGPMTANVIDGERFNSAFAFLDPVRDGGLLSIAPDAIADRVVFEGQRAVGVAVLRNGVSEILRADRIVLACGAYGTPALLQRSGVGPEALLRELGVPIVAMRPAGENLLDHPCAALHFEGSEEFTRQLRELDPHPDEQSVARARSSRCDGGPYDIHAFLVAGANTGHPGLPAISVYGAAMRARSRGTVKISSRNPEDLPIVDHAYLSDPDGHDAAVLTEALDLIETITADEQVRALFGPRVTPMPVDLASNVVTYAHPAGTCPMGPAGDPRAVSDGSGAVHDVDGLWIADASLMPTMTRGNPNLPITVMAARIAADLLDSGDGSVFEAIARS